MTVLKVLLVCQWYQPEPVSQPGWIVEALRAQGMAVEVLTGIPNYPTGEVIGRYRPWKAGTEHIDGIRVRRAPLYPSHDQSTVGRLLNYVSWALAASLAGLGALRRNDVSLVYSSPATAALPAMVGRWLFRTPYVLLVQDVWPDSIFASGFLGGRSRRIIESLVNVFVRMAYRQATHIAVISPGMVGLLADRGVPREKLSVVYNWVSEDDSAVQHVDPAEAGLRDSLGISQTDFVIMYAGNHGPAQALSNAVEAVATLTDESVHLVLVGDGIEKSDLVSTADRLGAKRIHFIDSVPRSEISDLMRQADVQLVSLANQTLFSVTTPSKLQSVLASGQPALVSANGDAASLVADSLAGVAAGAEDVVALQRAIFDLLALDRNDLSRMGDNGRVFYQQTMSAEVGGSRLATLLRAATSTEGRAQE